MLLSIVEAWLVPSSVQTKRDGKAMSTHGLRIWIVTSVLFLLVGATMIATTEKLFVPTTFDEPAFDVQGHRGARGLLPENTLPAFLKALELGVTTLEMDVVISKDNQVVLSHEPWFSSVICTQPDGSPIPEAEERTFRIYELTYAEVATFDCGSLGNPRFPQQEKMAVAKPLLRDVLAMAEAYTKERGQTIRYNIETKSTPQGDGIMHPEPEVFTRLLYDVVEAAGVKNRATLQSFDVRTLQVARQMDPSWELVLLIGAGGDQGLEANLETLGFVPEVYSPNYTLVDEALVEAVHAKGMLLIPWTINDFDEMQRLKDLGVDGVITDYPDLGVRLLGP